MPKDIAIADYYNKVIAHPNYYNESFINNHGPDYWDFENGKMTVSDMTPMVTRGNHDGTFQTFLDDRHSDTYNEK